VTARSYQPFRVPPVSISSCACGPGRPQPFDDRSSQVSDHPRTGTCRCWPRPAAVPGRPVSTQASDVRGRGAPPANRARTRSARGSLSGRPHSRPPAPPALTTPELRIGDRPHPATRAAAQESRAARRRPPRPRRSGQPAGPASAPAAAGSVHGGRHSGPTRSPRRPGSPSPPSRGVDRLSVHRHPPGADSAAAPGGHRERGRLAPWFSRVTVTVPATTAALAISW